MEPVAVLLIAMTMGTQSAAEVLRSWEGESRIPGKEGQTHPEQWVGCQGDRQ
jgi:hypothetical protein